ncbi:unnamed protein product, partial [Choristocarpus tenellus]
MSSQKPLISYFKRAVPGPSDASASPEAGLNKRQRADSKTRVHEGELVKCDPATILTWNANGLGLRLKNDWDEIRSFIQQELPDVFCIQEVRLPAAGLPKCKKDDNRGRQRGNLKADTTTDREDRELVARTLYRLAKELGYKVFLSLANYKYAGTASPYTESQLFHLNHPLLSLWFFCSPCFPHLAIYLLVGSPEHHEEGRVIVVDFHTFSMVNLYVPNNGVKDTSFLRRFGW